MPVELGKLSGNSGAFCCCEWNAESNKSGVRRMSIPLPNARPTAIVRSTLVRHLSQEKATRKKESRSCC